MTYLRKISFVLVLSLIILPVSVFSVATEMFDVLQEDFPLERLRAPLVAPDIIVPPDSDGCYVRSRDDPNAYIPIFHPGDGTWFRPTTNTGHNYVAYIYDVSSCPNSDPGDEACLSLSVSDFVVPSPAFPITDDYVRISTPLTSYGLGSYSFETPCSDISVYYDALTSRGQRTATTAPPPEPSSQPAPSQPSPTPSASGAVSKSSSQSDQVFRFPACRSESKCKEIDTVWQVLITQFIPSAPQKVWASESTDTGQWVKFDQIHVSPQQGVTLSSGICSSPRNLALLPVDQRAKGIDVSHHQGTINWPQVKSSGVSFAFIKSTESTGFVDSKSTLNAEGARLAGIPFGCYHFAKPSGAPNHIADAQAEARHFLRNSAHCLGDDNLLPVLDLENNDEGLTADQLGDWALAWMGVVEQEIGAKPIIYGRHYASDYTAEKLTNKYPLWVPHYGPASPAILTWNRWDFWQYEIGEKGAVPGIDAKIDLNYLYGGEDQLCYYKIGNGPVNLA